MLYLRGRHMRGQNLMLAAGLVVLGVVVVMTLNRFMTSEENGKRRNSQVYLTEESTVVGSRRSSDIDSGASQDGEGAIASKSDQSNSSRVKNRPYSFASGSKLFAKGATSKTEEAVNQDMRDLVTSSQVLVRLFGTSDGDFIYHQQHGWMKFVDGEWIVLNPFELPNNLHDMFPQLCEYPQASGGGGGDADFDRADWSANPQGKEEDAS